MDNTEMKNIIDANPTKEFFIEMLTRDIRLDRAIIDLVDNCIDGAKSIKPDEDYNGLDINISLSPNTFEIRDNCGGFSLEIARKYAFRFGRPSEKGAEFVRHSIGRFGVGMKRALFKIGSHFMVESKKENDHFLVEVNVDDWLNKKEWNFTYKEHDGIPESKKKLNAVDGTIITITNIHDNVKIDFKSNEFRAKLIREISLALSYSVLKGLSISVNNNEISRSDITMLQAENLRPLFIEKNISNVRVQVIAGVGDYSPDKAGWYVFCNDRLVLEADKSYVTGWKSTRQDEGSIVKYHNDYAMFRGAIFFDADDSKKLPMTTTKTGIDSDHSVFKSSRPVMLTAMKQVVNFLKKIESKEEGESIINTSTQVSINEIRNKSDKYSEILVLPKIKAFLRENKFVGISYQKEREKVENVKDYLGVTTNKEVGELTFEYFIEMNDL